MFLIRRALVSGTDRSAAVCYSGLFLAFISLFTARFCHS
jgi:hypothetical protein